MQKILTIILPLCLSASLMQAQIKIGGNVYGGGNEGNLGGKTQVSIYAGDLNKVYGGARRANVAGSASVLVDGEHMTGDITINYVYGGNDIAGTVGTSANLPTWVTAKAQDDYGINTTYNTFVGTTSERTETTGTGGEETTSQPYTIFIGQLFGGGNGDYTYSDKKANGKYDVTISGTTVEDVDLPEVAKTFVDLHGGTFGYVYAGGNNATVTEATDICINNHSAVTHKSNGVYFNMIDDEHPQGVTPISMLTTGSTNPNDLRLLDMGINLSTYNNDKLFRRVFGGNNKAMMHIRPKWHLHAGSIECLYSGGNEGNMTAPTGLLLEIGEANMTDEEYANLNANLKIENVYGGCRKADVRPLNDDGTRRTANEIQLTDTNIDGTLKYKFPAGLSARLLVRGGDIGNVYGGNDITGNVTGGNAVGVYTSIRGDIYGGGNGSYAYTDNPALADDVIWGDFYYSVPTGKTSVEALNDFRPNAEQVSVRVAGTEDNPIIIGGSIYVGGNSATLKPEPGKTDYLAHIKIGSYVKADKVFLGNNGEGMVDASANGVLAKYAGEVINDQQVEVDFSTLNLTDANTFNEYMKGCAMDLMPQVVFDQKKPDGSGDPATYIPYTSYFGSFYCGGNVGSMIEDGLEEILFDHEVIIFEKLVGGCNRAYVPKQYVDGDKTKNQLNAEYNGGLSGAADSNGNKLVLNLAGMKIQPKRWVTDATTGKKTGLEWNTYVDGEKNNISATEPIGPASETDMKRRFHGGNIYGGCYESGHVNGNVIININGTIIDREGQFGVFDSVGEDSHGEALYDNDSYNITERRSGVILDEQGMDVLSSALSLFGGGYGKNSEIWGSTTINLTKGYIFQIFGGGEQGAIGKGIRDADTNELVYSDYDAKYSTTINLHGTVAGKSKNVTDSIVAEAEFIYGGGFEGPIAGNTRVNLGNGRIFNSFAGSCNADILGHTETYIGGWPVGDGKPDETGFPWVRDHVYGGNDLGGRILGEGGNAAAQAACNFERRVRSTALPLVHGYDATTNANPDVLKASAYMEYTQGRVLNIFGGCYGDYNYSKPEYGTERVPYKPYMNNAFVNIRPLSTDHTKANTDNYFQKVFGAGQGHTMQRDGDKMQNRSYVLIDIPDGMENFKNALVFGAGSYNGLGMKYTLEETQATTPSAFDLDKASAIVDLVQGQIKEAYGGSFNEGITRRTVVNVPAGTTAKSTILANRIFGGAYGADITKPCDVYESNINYRSDQAVMKGNPGDIGTNFKGEANQQLAGGIYGGNNNCRRTLYAKVNIHSKAVQNKDNGYTTRVFGAGYGADTWAQYTEVNLENGADVYEVYGGGYGGMVLNKESVDKAKTATLGSEWDVSLGDGYSDSGLEDPLVKTNELGLKCNANVYVKDGAWVSGYAYGGGLGATANVCGTVYFGLLGGEVNKDIYGSGTQGSVMDYYRVADDDNNAFVATTNVYVKGGQARNVYGSGWRGSVGLHDGLISDVANNGSDIDGVANVIIGTRDGTTHSDGVPSITRNVYGGGEGGAVYGTANVTVNNGYIGYRYKNTGTAEEPKYEYVAELDDTDAGDNKLDRGGNVFGGGYVANSYTDISNLLMWKGTVRGSLYGGGEIGPIGRGTVLEGAAAPTGTIVNGNAKIYKGGESHVYLYGGHVMRDVFGGGRGYDNWGGKGWMTSEEEASMDISSKGYVFGSTDVHIRGGEVGTEAGVLRGYGNVFGGGNEGYVYSATGKKVGVRVSDSDRTEGMPTGGGGYYYKNGVISEGLTLDCNVDVEPYCRLTSGTLSFSPVAGKVAASYGVGDYVPVEALNQLKNKNSDGDRWNQLNQNGVKIHNAVFAGGNITEGSEIVHANTVTVFGNVAASVRDVYNRDLISLGTEDIGGVYGDGNLTLVDGFREVHIDNYGTDYYSLDPQMNLEGYNNLTEREKAYYQLKYVTATAHTYEYYESKSLHSYTPSGGEQKDYRKGQKITDTEYDELSGDEKENWVQGSKSFDKDDQIEEGEYLLMDETEKDKWTLYGVCSKYAGRPMNTIQRADMCGVFGSRLVLKGAQDRVPSKVDYNNYTINRVDEVSLNQRQSQAGDGEDDAIHGNYFGIYSVVNYLGNLTSDVFFTKASDDAPSATRETDISEGSLKADGQTTYYEWKTASTTPNKYKNNATSKNKVALASGVCLEIKREGTEAAGKDVWGDITGVIELDLINVMQGMGGGYVYARNEHGDKSWHKEWEKVTLLDYNKSARTYRRFTYDQTSLQTIETSGNFVHNTKQIVDDCYPNNGVYQDGYTSSPAHYWFIKGSVYVYDQYISAYTGAASAYAEKVEIPLTISAAANGKITLREVQPNYYAYYDKHGHKLGTTGAEESFTANNIAYSLNTPISYWEYRLLTEGEKTQFVEETYTVVGDCKVGETLYPEGYVLLPGKTDGSDADTYYALKKAVDEGAAVTYEEDGVVKTDKGFDYFFRPSNNLGHDTGYALTFDVNNPMIWNNYYTKTDSPGQGSRLNTDQYFERNSDGTYKVEHSLYTEGPTYSPTANGFSGQHEYKKGNIINGNIYKTYEQYKNNLDESVQAKQAEVKRAWIVTEPISVKDTEGNEVKQLNEGVAIAETDDYTNAQWTAITTSGHAEEAQVCIKTLELNSSDYVYVGKILSKSDVDNIKAQLKEKFEWTGDDAETKATNYLKDYVTDAYYCTKDGLYGGSFYEAGKAYRILDTWNAMSAADREKFKFNYDAFDVLIDPTYGDRLESNYGKKEQYDGTLNPKIYSPAQPIDYQAQYIGKDETKFTNKAGETITLTPPTSETSEADWWSRERYEAIPNEKRHYSPIIVTAPGYYYVVKNTFMRGDIPYTKGQTISESVYNSLTDAQKQNITSVNFTEAQTHKDGSEYVNTYYYYCFNSYTIDEKGEGIAVTPLSGTEIPVNSVVPEGTIISKEMYERLPNFQKYFVIHGMSPTITSTLYVSSESDINDLTKEKIITVIYLYEYEESDESGLNVTPVSERHVVNIHINFRSGIPEIGKLDAPSLVLPGTSAGLQLPGYTEGAYVVTNAGWEMFSNQSDADTHTNGMEFVNNETPLYLYQNGYYVAYYVETYLGKTYSNSVQFKVANYHDLKRVIDDKRHHYYIDHENVKVSPNIYVNDYSSTGENGLDMLKKLYDVSLHNDMDEDGHPKKIDNDADGHYTLNARVRGAKKLEFFLRTDLDHSGSPWTPIGGGDGEPCFSGTLHGDGHHISGLSNSLFGKLCGSVYNLGVTGSFTGGGVADSGEGYVANCWVKTTGTPLPGMKAVLGKPEALSGTQIFNCYYPKSNGYDTEDNGRGIARAMEERDFYNGTVAYNLNGYYLYKRYYDQKQSDSEAMGSSPKDYAYYEVGSDGLTKRNGKYGEAFKDFTYVEERFADGDFVYACGEIPTEPDERSFTDPSDPTKTAYYPIWPHDYLFFGQRLNYGHVEEMNHQDYPSFLIKDNNRAVIDETGNRVFRAPAYFGSKAISMAHFNPYAVFAKSKKNDSSTEAYQGMTAIDFTGGNNDLKDGYKKEWQTNGTFFPPLLDDGGLSKFINVDLTQNLLAYTMDNSTTVTAAGKKTYDAVRAALPDETYSETNSNYRTVDFRDPTYVRGHHVILASSDYVATKDHLLVDREDFNCPISYKFDNDHRMWYQRTPERYVGEKKNKVFVDSNAGWETVSLPFTAELVTTDTKGEITHFYSGSKTYNGNAAGEKDARVGHEYWLREFIGKAQEENSDPAVYVAAFNYPDAEGEEKTVTNTFLWDYYYHKNYVDEAAAGQDMNTDIYQTYYKESRNYADYPRLAAATPYIVGFPGERYYEFDLSGSWKAQTTADVAPAQLSKQVVTFASKPDVSISVSDDELASSAVTEDGYTFKGNYMSQKAVGWHMNDAGNAFERQMSAEKPAEPVAVATVPFRPYFVATTGGAPRLTRSIVFDSDGSQFAIGDERESQDGNVAESVDIRTGKRRVVVTSRLRHKADVRIFNAGGLCVATFDVEPGQTIEHPILHDGIYVVHVAGGRYRSKLAVR